MKLSLPISIVIPTYNGIKLLKKYLNSVINNAPECEIIVVDDASNDGTTEWLSQHYPQVITIKNTTNQGFANSVNKGFSKASNELVLLLNNDVRLEKNTITELLTPFADKKVFAVGAMEKLPNEQQRGKSIGRFERGLLVHSAAQLTKGTTLWVFGASGLFRKSIWLQLGGLDTLFAPAYWEDIDICYRAWKCGYTCLFNPQAQLFHQSESTMNTHLNKNKTIVVLRNQLLFFWKNVTDLDLWLAHIFWLPYHLLVTSYRTQGAFMVAFWQALLRIPKLHQQKYSLSAKITDLEVINKIA